VIAEIVFPISSHFCVRKVRSELQNICMSSLHVFLPGAYYTHLLSTALKCKWNESQETLALIYKGFLSGRSISILLQ